MSGLEGLCGPRLANESLQTFSLVCKMGTIVLYTQWIDNHRA